MADIRQRTASTTERFMARTKERNRRDYHLKRLDNVGDLSVVEDRSRLAKRMRDWGMSVDEAMEALAKQEDASPDRPVSEFFLERIIAESELIVSKPPEFIGMQCRIARHCLSQTGEGSIQ